MDGLMMVCCELLVLALWSGYESGSGFVEC